MGKAHLIDHAGQLRGSNLGEKFELHYWPAFSTARRSFLIRSTTARRTHKGSAAKASAETN